MEQVIVGSTNVKIVISLKYVYYRFVEDYFYYIIPRHIKIIMVEVDIQGH